MTDIAAVPLAHRRSAPGPGTAGLTPPAIGGRPDKGPPELSPAMLPPADLSPATLRALRRALLAASDAQVRRVVELVDQMAQRGLADDLIDPLRQRLQQLRPPRRLRFERLLFLPLDPLVVPASAWRAGDPTVPRTAIVPLARMVWIALRRETAPIHAAITGRTVRDIDAVEQAGALLWEDAARILAIAPRPPEWADAGLSAAVYAPITTAVAAVLARRAALESLIQDANSGLFGDGEAALTAILEDMAGETPESMALIIALLLARLPRAGPLLSVLDSMARAGTPVGGTPVGAHPTAMDLVALRRAVDKAVDAQVDRLDASGGVEARVAGLSLESAGAEIRRLNLLLRELETRSGDGRRRTVLRGIRQRLDAGCRTRFIGALKDEFLAPLQALASTIDPSVQTLLETTARHLRELDTEARQIGGADDYDTQLRQAAATVGSIPATGGLSPARRGRLVEILAGADAAMILLENAS